MKPSPEIETLLAIMAKLRDRDTGCAWDKVQNFASIAPYTIEEAYEVADAIYRDDMVDLCEELGDLLLQVVFHAQMAQEVGHFSFPDLVLAITTKLIRRHPHIFSSGSALTPQDVKAKWDEIKQEERLEKAAKKAKANGISANMDKKFLDDVPITLPAIMRAVKLQQRASEVGFDWDDAKKVFDKIREEIQELEEAIEHKQHAEIEEEMGDVFFVLANLSRHLSIEPEKAIVCANQKFYRRFSYIEQKLASNNITLKDASLDQMEDLWNEAKIIDKNFKK